MKDLRTEEEIISNWKGDIGKPVVSICCITYNHESYIEDVLEGFLKQETDFPFEILIHDDASTDRTAEIIREYEEKYPRLIKPIYQTENQYSKGIKVSSVFNFPRATGEYIAMCEGDDKWLSSQKLLEQYYALENSKNVNLCFHSAYCELNSERFIMGDYGRNHVPIEDIISKKFGQIATSSVFIRIEGLEGYLSYVEDRNWLTVGDIYLLYFSAVPNGAIFINRPMSLYRMMLPGSWTQSTYSSDKSKSKILNHIKARIRSYEELNIMSGYVYKLSFQQSSLKQVHNYMKNTGIPLRAKVKLLSDNTIKYGVFSKLKCMLYMLWALR
jgi:glycosyltransferase involved in cell wall biosynthesis